MINSVSDYLANKLKDKNGMPPYDIIRYSIKVMVVNSITIFCIVLSGYLTDLFFQTITVAASFAILRNFSGGYHIRSAEACVLVSTMLMTAIVFIAPYLFEYQLELSIVSLILIFLFGTKNIKNHTIIKEDNFYIFKFCGLALIVFSIFIQNHFITTAFFIQSVLLLPPLILKTKGGE